MKIINAKLLIKIARKILADYTMHYMYDRKDRNKFITNVLGGPGVVIYQGYTANRNSHLPEVHKVCSNGIIVIVNPLRGLDRIVTMKIARPGQIYEVYRMPRFVSVENGKVITKGSGATPTPSVLKKAKFYEAHSWNYDQDIPSEDEWLYWKEQVNKIR